ncbi:MAG: hypothetical protein O7E51_07510 [Acidobacteria bacterium]|nr:hypothetical protein [Acidobacteriota bacterium]
MKKPAIRLRVEELKRVSSERAVTGLGLSKAWVLQKLRENIEAADKAGDGSAVNRGLELIGKELRMFVDRKVVGVQALIAELTPENLRNASADDLVSLVATLDAALEDQPVEVQALPSREQKSTEATPETRKLDSETVQ